MVHFILYSTLGRRTILWRYTSCLVVSALLRSMFANRRYSVLHCFLTNEGFSVKESHTPKNLNEVLGAMGVIEKEFDERLKRNGIGVGPSSSVGAAGFLLVINSALVKLIFLLFIA